MALQFHPSLVLALYNGHALSPNRSDILAAHTGWRPSSPQQFTQVCSVTKTVDNSCEEIVSCVVTYCAAKQVAFAPQRTAPQQVAPVAAHPGTKQQRAGVLQIVAYAGAGPTGAAPSLQAFAEVVRRHHQVTHRCTSSCSLYLVVPRCGSSRCLLQMSSTCFHKQTSKVDFVYTVLPMLTCLSA